MGLSTAAMFPATTSMHPCLTACDNFTIGCGQTVNVKTANANENQYGRYTKRALYCHCDCSMLEHMATPAWWLLRST